MKISGLIHTEPKPAKWARGPLMNSDEVNSSLPKFVGIPLLYEHDFTSRVGTVLSAYIDDKNICINAMMDMTTWIGRWIASKIESKQLLGLSIGQGKGFEPTHFRRYTDYTPTEVSICREGCMDRSRITIVYTPYKFTLFKKNLQDVTKMSMTQDEVTEEDREWLRLCKKKGLVTNAARMRYAEQIDSIDADRTKKFEQDIGLVANFTKATFPSNVHSNTMLKYTSADDDDIPILVDVVASAVRKSTASEARATASEATLTEAQAKFEAWESEKEKENAALKAEVESLKQRTPFISNQERIAEYVTKPLGGIALNRQGLAKLAFANIPPGADVSVNASKKAPIPDAPKETFSAEELAGFKGNGKARVAYKGPVEPLQ